MNDIAIINKENLNMSGTPPSKDLGEVLALVQSSSSISIPVRPAKAKRQKRNVKLVENLETQIRRKFQEIYDLAMQEKTLASQKDNVHKRISEKLSLLADEPKAKGMDITPREGGVTLQFVTAQQQIKTANARSNKYKLSNDDILHLNEYLKGKYGFDDNRVQQFIAGYSSFLAEKEIISLSSRKRKKPSEKEIKIPKDRFKLVWQKKININKTFIT